MRVSHAELDLPLADPRPAVTHDHRPTREGSRVRTADAAGGPRDGEQALDADTVLHGYTTAAAAVAGTEQTEGRLVPGMAADITLLGEDPVAADPDALPDVPVVATVVAGQVVYRG